MGDGTLTGSHQNIWRAEHMALAKDPKTFLVCGDTKSQGVIDSGMAVKYDKLLNPRGDYTRFLNRSILHINVQQNIKIQGNWCDTMICYIYKYQCICRFFFIQIFPLPNFGLNRLNKVHILFYATRKSAQMLSRMRDGSWRLVHKLTVDLTVNSQWTCL